HQIIGGEGRGQLGRVEQRLLPVRPLAFGHLHAKLTQQLAEEARVRQTRHVGQQQGLIGQDRRRHQLDRRVLGSADRNGAVEAMAAVDDDAVHGYRDDPGARTPTARQTGYLARLTAAAKGRNVAGRMTFSCFPWATSPRPRPAPCDGADWPSRRRPDAPRVRPWPRRPERRLRWRKETSRRRGASRLRLWSACS